MKNKKLKTKIEFKFGEQEEVPVLNVDIKFETCKKSNNIKIIEHKRKRKIIDPSTKLF